MNSGATLTLDDTTAISGGTITIDTGGKLVMDGTGLGDTISGSIIDVSGTLTMSGTDQILGGSIVIDGKLNADGTDTISGTTITVDSGGLLNTNGTVTLGDDTVTNDQAAGIVVSGGSLTLNSGTTITNTLTANSIVIDSGATLTLDDTTAISGGTITIDTGGKLVMDGTGLGDTISGSIIDVSGTLTMSGTDQILGGSIVIDGKLNADGTDTISGTTITVDSGGLLNTNGTVTLGDDTVTNDQAAGIVVSGGSLTLNSGTTITNTLTADSIVVDSGATLTLDNTTAISGGTITIDTGGKLDVLGSGNSIGSATIANTGIIDVGNGVTAAALTLSGDQVTDSGSITVQGEATLTLTATTISGTGSMTIDTGAMVIGSGVIGGSQLTLINDGIIEALGGTLEIVPSLTGTGELEIGNLATLQLDGSDAAEQITFLGNTGRPVRAQVL